MIYTLIDLTPYLPYMLIAVIVLCIIHLVLLLIFMRKSSKRTRELIDTVHGLQSSSSRTYAPPVQNPKPEKVIPVTKSKARKIKPIDWEY